jgi:hypothetical protein
MKLIREDERRFAMNQRQDSQPGGCGWSRTCDPKTCNEVDHCAAAAAAQPEEQPTMSQPSSVHDPDQYPYTNEGPFDHPHKGFEASGNWDRPTHEVLKVNIEGD